MEKEILKYKGFKILFYEKKLIFKATIKHWTPNGRREALNNGNYLYNQEYLVSENLKDLIIEIDKYSNRFKIIF